MAKKTTKKKATKKKTKKRPKRSPVEASAEVDPVVAEASERVLAAEGEDDVEATAAVEATAEAMGADVETESADEVCYFEIGLRASVVDRVRELTNGEDDLEAKIAGLVEQALSETGTPASGNLIDEALIGELDPDFQEAHAELLRRDY